MTQTKTVLLPTEKLNKTDVSHISSFLFPFPIFKSPVMQKKRILNRLAQYAVDNNIDKICDLLTIRPDLRTEVLFTLAGLGAQDQMELILNENPRHLGHLLLYRPLRDISGACFKNITLFQHALWAKDVRYMANMMLDCLPKNERGEQIRLELVRQYEELMAQGVDFQLNGAMHENERHFSLQPLIAALDAYVTNYDNWTEKERIVHWCTVLGQAQTLLPAHIRHHYCNRDETFWGDPKLKFQQPKLVRHLSVYNFSLRKYQEWSAGLVGLGLDFGIVGIDSRGTGGTICQQQDVIILPDLAAIKALDEMRTFDLQSLVKRLYTPIQNLEKKQALTLKL